MSEKNEIYFIFSQVNINAMPYRRRYKKRSMRRKGRRRGSRRNPKFTSRVRSIVKKKTGAVSYDTTFLCERQSGTNDILLNQPIQLFPGFGNSNFPYKPRYWMLDISRALCSTNQSAVNTGDAHSYTRDDANGLTGWPGASTTTVDTTLPARCSAVMNGAKYMHESTSWNFFVRNDNAGVGMRLKLYILECRTTAIDTAKFFQGVGPPTFPEWATLKYQRTYYLSPKPSASNNNTSQAPMTWAKNIAGRYIANKAILDARTSYAVTSGGTTETREPNEKGHLFMLLGWSFVAADASVSVNDSPFLNGYIRSKYRDTI